MFSVIFEVHPKPERFDEYLELAKHLKPILETIDGFVDNERFESRTRPGWLLSHSTWRDEKSVIRWRTEGEHHKVQERGRFEIFADYHLRVGDVTFDSAPSDAAPVREQRLDETETGEAKLVTLTELVPADGVTFGSDIANSLSLSGPDLVAHDLFASIYNKGKIALLASWKTAEAGARWQPCLFDGVKTLRHRRVRVIRDYGMFDRRETPQFYPAVEGSTPGRSAPGERP
ncbi:MAG: antibiotic biosynthesis monooxygenase [Rhodospirillales bacterium]|nr:antibiotic biosynthesis monooxygenase [Rhodospirillales bacterium]